MKTLLSCLFVLLLIASTNSCKKTEIDPKDDPVKVINAESLTKRLNQVWEESNFPGFSIGIVKNGNSAYQNSFGYQNTENKVAYTNQTIQPIASISKTFLAAAVVKAIELGHFTLETPINDLLPLPIVNPKNTSGIIKVKHLVTHTSGLIDEDENYFKSYYILLGENTTSSGAQILLGDGITQRTPKTLKEFIEAYFYKNGAYYSNANFANTEPGDVIEYSNTASSLMAYVIESVSGVSFKEFVKQHVFTPLNMTVSSYDYNLPLTKYATLYFNENTPFPFYDLESFPDGGLKTSNEDFMMFLLDMIEGRKGNSTTLFDKSYYELLFSEQSSEHAIFWELEGAGDLGHTGGDPGVTTELHFNGDDNAGYFILSNYDTDTNKKTNHYLQIAHKIKQAIADFLNL